MSTDPSGQAEDAAEGGQLRASTLELFFDLVFVFTITQLTHVFSEHPGWVELGRVALMFGVIWWMYSGYVFLTNEVAPNSTVRRTWLLVGMLGFFVVALAVPEAFHGSGLAFGIGYFVVNTVHTGLFYSNGGGSASSAALRIAPLNLLSAGLVLAGGLVHGWPRYVIWGAALAVQIVTPYLVDTGGFVIRASHFAERHGLVIIVALGESVVAVGAALAGMEIGVALVTTVALGLGLAYVLWWAYFGFDDERGELALEALPRTQRVRPAVLAYGYALYPLLIGIIVTAAGIRLTVAHGHSASSWPAAWALSGGVALFFVGQTMFRVVLGLPRAWTRLAAVPVVLATAPIGAAWLAWAQLAAVLLVAFLVVVADDTLSLRTGDTSAYVNPATALLRVTRRSA
ncbi:low temperature requirement protein A [Nocardia sp. alder85J]|uniref:low temperature requirement protein A n=1 Tax=Nocardia sp. alder85J TaxID=2862949 RepID=UPI001CD641FB|nr:low temperature requirement protein A [Nocardia sp. alder85J]MCX4098318.1 low temperature requirement protein A [Nocardia sp. alder85J]